MPFLTLSPTNAGSENAAVLQALCDQKGKIEITEPGIYDIDRTIFLSSDTELVFGEGVVLRRQKCDEPDVLCDWLFVNRGAFNRRYDENITIRGLHLCCNNVEARYFDSPITGLAGQLSFFYIRHLHITDFECTDVTPENFCIQVCTFQDAVIENVVIKGRKDGVHLGYGDGFVIRNGRFCTFDDPIALNAHDYATSNPQLGWIRNGLVENCVDLADTDTVGFFARLLAGSWCDWQKGMKIRYSDTVVHGGRMYRAALRPDGKEFISETPPTHESGHAVLDGIDWVMVQDDAVCYNCGCENIIFRDIRLQKKRPIAFCIHFDDDNWSHSYYPGSKAPVQRNLTFQNITVENEIDLFLFARTAIENTTLKNCLLGSSRIGLDELPYDGLTYPNADFNLENVAYNSQELFAPNTARELRRTYTVINQKS